MISSVKLATCPRPDMFVTEDLAALEQRPKKLHERCIAPADFCTSFLHVPSEPQVKGVAPAPALSLRGSGGDRY